MTHSEHMTPGIEVLGTATALEVARRQRVAVTVTLDGKSSLLGKSGMHMLSAQRDRLIQTLREHGLRQDELSEGGRDTSTWRGRGRKEQSSSYRVLICCDDTPRLYQALDALESVADGSKFDLQIDMLGADHEVPPANLAQARRAALEDARLHAQTLAEAAGLKLGPVVSVQELSAHARSSGAMGDYGMMRLAAAGGGPAETLDPSQRTLTLQYRVRFALA